MEWTVAFYALFLATIFSLVGVSFSGWQRPGRRAVETLAYSVLFFAVILFMGVMAASVWLPTLGPIAWRVPWLSLLVIAVVIFLLIALMSSTGAPVDIEDVASVGLGMAFWLLMGLLMTILLSGVFA